MLKPSHDLHRNDRYMKMYSDDFASDDIFPNNILADERHQINPGSQNIYHVTQYHTDCRAGNLIISECK